MRHSHYTIFFLFFSIFYLYANQENENNTNPILQKETVNHFILNDKNTDSIKSFLSATNLKNAELAKEYYLLFLERGVKEKNQNIQFHANYYLGDIAYTLGDYISAIKYSNIATKIAEELNDESLKLSSYTLTGNSFFAIRYYNNASVHYQKAKAAAQKLNTKENEIASEININNCWVRIDRYNEALQSYEGIQKKLQQKEYRGDLYYGNFLSTQIGSGVCHYKLGNYQEAIFHYKEGLITAKKLQSAEIQAVFHNTLGEAYTAKKEYDRAEKHLDTAQTLALQNKKIFDQNLFTTSYHLASLYFEQQEFQKSLEVLKESFDTLDSEEQKKQVEKIDEMYDLAKNCAKKLNDSKSQLVYSNAYNTIIAIRHKDDIKTRDQLYDYDLLQLEEEKEVLQSKNSMYIIGLAIVVIILLSFFVYHLQKQKKNKKIFEELQKTTTKDPDEKDTEPKKGFITDQKVKDLFQKLQNLEATKFYLNENCNLYTTAKKINTNTSYLSKMMNTHKKQSFNDYINGLRIEHCRERLHTDSKFRSYTIKAIANELGYKSVNTFASAFKKHTGLSHSYYIKQIQISVSK